MNRKLARPLLGLALAGSLLAAAPAAFADGGVVALENTPHIFVRDATGALHLAADAQALSGHNVDWRTRTEISPEDLRGMTRGEPWVSMALVKIDDAIYLPQMPAGGGAPVLRLVKSVADLTLLGVEGENYGRLVMEQQAWEARYGLQADALRFEDLSLDAIPPVSPSLPAPSTQSEGETESATA